MGPFGRQALRVMYAAGQLNLPDVSVDLITEVLNDCGVLCTSSQIGGALGSLATASPDLLYKVQGDSLRTRWWERDYQTLGWGLTAAGRREVMKPAPEWMARPRDKTRSYAYRPTRVQLIARPLTRRGAKQRVPG